MSPRDNAHLTRYQHDLKIPSHSIDGFEGTANGFSHRRRAIIQSPDIDPAMTHPQLVANHQEAILEQTETPLADSSFQHCKDTSVPHSKSLPVNQQAEVAPNNIGSQSNCGKRLSDHNGSKTAGRLADDEKVTSNIMEQNRRTIQDIQNPEKQNLALRAFIKTNELSLPDPKNPPKRGCGSSLGTKSPSSQQGTFRCPHPNCNKMKKTQCDLKYSSLVYLIGTKLRIHPEQ